MSHMILELILWMLLAFLVGCVIGYLARRLFGTEADVVGTTRVEHEAAKVAKTVELPTVVEPQTVAESSPAAAVIVDEPPLQVERVAAPAEPLLAVSNGKPERPKGIAKPRGGKPDNLQRVSGIGPKYERTLHGLGFYHFDQISIWTEEHVDWVDDHLKFNGRIRRDEWIVQAALLAEGKEEEFLQKYGTGGLKGKSGESKSGTRTRRR